MSERKGTHVCSGYCPSLECKKKLFFPSNLCSSIECASCGKYYEKSSLLDVSDDGVALENLLQNISLNTVKTDKRGSESVKTLGLSNYQCKLVSPLLTRYGFEKATGTVKTLKEMGKGETFDCCILCDRAFLIEEKKLDVSGYGRDRSGAEVYLKHTLDEIERANSNTNRNKLVPIHADGDGHCLVHAVSRALLGQELFWHPLMTGLKLNLMNNIDEYKHLMKDFINEDEWDDIIREADPDFESGNGEQLGLRNIHIFALANLLHRPIILMDGQDGMHSKGDYSATFLPVLIPPEKCKGKEKKHLNKPLVIAWSSLGRNHFVPLVGLTEKPAPQLPKTLLPSPWAVSHEKLEDYLEFDSNGYCTVGGERSLGHSYLQKLVLVMEKKFEELYGVSPVVVTDVYQHIFKPYGVVGVTPQLVTEAAQVAIDEERLYKCLACSFVTEKQRKFPISSLTPGGLLYSIALSTVGKLKDGCQYKFPQHKKCICRYDKKKNRLIPLEDPSALVCKLCQGPLRVLRRNGSLVYSNGDRTTTEAKKNICNCGRKHYWDGHEYDNLPERLPVTLKWNNQIKKGIVYWFQFESDPSLNSDESKEAKALVQKLFPGIVKSEKLVEQVIDQISRKTGKYQPRNKGKVEIRRSTPTKVNVTVDGSKSVLKVEVEHSRTEDVEKEKINGAAGASAASAASSVASVASAASAASAIQQEKSSESSTSSSPREKRVRISASHGRTATVPLSSNMTYKDLQDAISSNFNIPAELQRIKYGFPRKELKPPNKDDEANVVPLQHGDSVFVEEINEHQKFPGTAPIFSSGDRVAVALDEDTVRSIHESLGGWNDKMRDVIGKIGKVLQINAAGHVVVTYAAKNNWIFPEACLRKNCHITVSYAMQWCNWLKRNSNQLVLNSLEVQSFRIGDQVTVVEERAILEKMQKDRGGWTDGMEDVLGKVGEVVAVGRNDMVTVKFEAITYSLSPAALSKEYYASGSGLKLSSSNNSLFSPDDRVVIALDVDILRFMLEQRCGWVDAIEDTIGRIGTVFKVDSDGDIHVKYELTTDEWTFHPDCLKKVESFIVGDTIEVLENKEIVVKMQEGHGGWADFMENFLGKIGTVMLINSNGDIKVKMQNSSEGWTDNVKMSSGKVAGAKVKTRKGPVQLKDINNCSRGIEGLIEGLIGIEDFASARTCIFTPAALTKTLEGSGGYRIGTGASSPSSFIVNNLDNGKDAEESLGTTQNTEILQTPNNPDFSHKNVEGKFEERNEVSSGEKQKSPSKVSKETVQDSDVVNVFKNTEFEGSKEEEKVDVTLE